MPFYVYTCFIECHKIFMINRYFLCMNLCSRKIANVYSLKPHTRLNEMNLVFYTTKHVYNRLLMAIAISKWFSFNPRSIFFSFGHGTTFSMRFSYLDTRKKLCILPSYFFHPIFFYAHFHVYIFCQHSQVIWQVVCFLLTCGIKRRLDLVHSREFTIFSFPTKAAQLFYLPVDLIPLLWRLHQSFSCMLAYVISCFHDFCFVCKCKNQPTSNVLRYTLQNHSGPLTSHTTKSISTFTFL